MRKISIPNDVNPREYYLDILPKIFKPLKSKYPPNSETRLRIKVIGPNGGSWNVVIDDKFKLSVSEGISGKPQIAIEMRESDWRDMVLGKIRVLTSIYNLLSPKKSKADYRGTLDLKGKLVMILLKRDGDEIEIVLLFKGVEKPETKIKMAMNDYLDLMKGAIEADNAYFKGKIEIEGDIIFAMQAGQYLFRSKGKK